MRNFLLKRPFVSVRFSALLGDTGKGRVGPCTGIVCPLFSFRLFGSSIPMVRGVVWPSVGWGLPLPGLARTDRVEIGPAGCRLCVFCVGIFLLEDFLATPDFQRQPFFADASVPSARMFEKMRSYTAQYLSSFVQDGWQHSIMLLHVFC